MKFVEIRFSILHTNFYRLFMFSNWWN